MKDLKYTLKELVKHEKGTKSLSKRMLKALWRDFVVLAVAVSVLAYAVLRVSTQIAIPMRGLSLADAGQFDFTASLAENVVLSVLLIAAAVLAVFASIRAHRTMRAFVGGFERKDMGRERRNLLLVENTFIVLAILLVAALPAFVLFASAIASACSAETADAIAVPMWAISAFCVTAFVGMLMVEAVLTVVRLTFRELARQDDFLNTVENADNQPIS